MPNTFSPERYLEAASDIIAELRWLRQTYPAYWDISDESVLEAYRYLIHYQSLLRVCHNGIPELLPISELTLAIARCTTRMLKIDKDHRYHHGDAEARENIEYSVDNLRRGLRMLKAELRNLAY